MRAAAGDNRICTSDAVLDTSTSKMGISSGIAVWESSKRKKTLARFRLPLIVMMFMLFPVLPCYAYGDPSGGTLFQILMPAMAAIWGMWMIFANNIRRRASKLLRRWRGASTDN